MTPTAEKRENAWLRSTRIIHEAVTTFPDLPGALCVESSDPDLWFVDEAAHHAKAICEQCPVRAACLQWALDNEIRHGVWGGKTPRERWRILHTRRGKRRPKDDDSRDRIRMLLHIGMTPGQVAALAHCPVDTVQRIKDGAS